MQVNISHAEYTGAITKRPILWLGTITHLIISYARVLHHYSEFHGPSTPNSQVIHNKPITAKVKKIQFTKLILNNK